MLKRTGDCLFFIDTENKERVIYQASGDIEYSPGKGLRESPLVVPGRVCVDLIRPGKPRYYVIGLPEWVKERFGKYELRGL